MKKLFLSLSLFLSFSSLVHAQWTTNGANTITVTNNLVGIGTTTPNTTLYLQNANSNYVPTLTLKNTSNNIASRTGLTMENSAGYQTFLYKQAPGNTDANDVILYSEQGDTRVYTAGLERFRIGSSGNVGVGTQAPSNYFHGGNNKLIEIFNPNTAINSQSHIILSTGATSDGSSAGTLTWISKNSTNVQGMAYIGAALQGDATTNAASKIVFATSDGSTVIPKMQLDKDGNVAIGTLDPKGYKLAVNGSAIATSMTVKLNSAWPDYVFKKDYQLPSLQDVKAYIDQNQHLPEIPSEQQIAKDGLNLGEMNKLLMKKVEELTLYLIEKDQQLKDQEKINRETTDRIQNLEERLNVKQKTN
ncbi:hypothetical protein [Mucilaginibacter lappiensis]|uniref:Uncharacterized protein n=1 Tax=Mucilaginibacter lappiensis TaxID=354630 RepID=A0A841JGV1_9SPHI|nr:hypothetical protein [Mucilaginibacter lappiensis]MBB6130393.1 hypothetical protein [Mucilaginibacter lappiensis]